MVIEGYQGQKRVERENTGGHDKYDSGKPL